MRLPFPPSLSFYNFVYTLCNDYYNQINMSLLSGIRPPELVYLVTKLVVPNLWKTFAPLSASRSPHFLDSMYP